MSIFVSARVLPVDTARAAAPTTTFRRVSFILIPSQHISFVIGKVGFIEARNKPGTSEQLVHKY
ncbi:hypothetical protein FHS21_005182 [Phyllobacterium trifolii]|uniref:Uncharacterized protein n=1 Tax=Phyllobacterium trifolii TaxID=300193 RepID=A0A839UFZ6_9HYPH|nr:hypothetical protein [Phyllobacterium trifolii]